MNIDINTEDVNKMFAGMEKDALRPAFKKAFRQAGKVLLSAVQGVVKQKYPGGKRADSGKLRGVQYGPLCEDVKMGIYKNGEGVNVSIFSNRKRQNRWCVLYWLNNGADRTGAKSAYTRMTNGHAPSARGVLSPSNFFSTAISGAKSKAEQTLMKALPEEVIKQANKRNK